MTIKDKYASLKTGKGSGYFYKDNIQMAIKHLRMC